MDAARFEELYVEHVVAPTRVIGFERWGKSLRWQDPGSGLRAVVLRTELRNTWPFELTLVIGHAYLRDFKDRVPAPWSRDPSEYPVKCKPSETAELVRRFHYTPRNLGQFPKDTMTDSEADRQLAKIGTELARRVPELPARLTPAVLIDQIARRGEQAWCEQRWIEDYRSQL